LTLTSRRARHQTKVSRNPSHPGRGTGSRVATSGNKFREGHTSPVR
jgi:hypothetical protein